MKDYSKWLILTLTQLMVLISKNRIFNKILIDEFYLTKSNLITNLIDSQRMALNQTILWISSFPISKMKKFLEVK